MTVLILTFGFWVFIPSTLASSSDNVAGFAWSPNTGWISFNSTDCDLNDDGTVAVGEKTGCSAVPGIYKYGVKIDPANGYFFGLAWSPNFGWLSFDVPDATHPRTQVQPSEAVTGWARFLNYGVGWDGWVRFDHGQANSVTLSAGALHGYAWGGGDAVASTKLGPGWILMDGVTTTYSPVSAPSGLSVVAGYCGAVYNMVTFSWVPSGSLPVGSLYTLQINKNKNSLWGDAGDWVQSLDVTLASVSFVDAFGPELSRGYSANPGSYQWRVGVDSSNWSSVATVTLQPHDSPSVAFSLSSALPNPLNPKQRQFNNTSSCVSGPCTWVWTMPSGVAYKQGTNLNSQAPLVEFPEFTPPSPKYTVTLNVTDSTGYTCSLTNDQVSVGNAAAAIPQWRRWLPF